MIPSEYNLYKLTCVSRMELVVCLHGQKQCRSCQNPLCRRLVCFETEAPDVGGAAEFGAVHWALVGVPHILLVDGYRAYVQHWHSWSQLLQNSL